NGYNGLPTVVGNILIRGQGATIAHGDSKLDFRFFEVSSQGFLELSAVALKSGRSAFPGGAIFIADSGKAIIGDSLLAWNQTWDLMGIPAGGAIYVGSGSQLLVYSTSFSGNMSGQRGGGAISMAGSQAPSDVTILYSTFVSNWARNGGSGGAI